jgi:hypothetical protein
MAKADTKLIMRPKRTDPEEFKRFMEAARKRRFDESLEDFAVKFFKIVPPRPAIRRPD